MTPGIEQPRRIGQRLQLPHDLESLAAPLGFHKRRHVAPGAMLGLQRPVEALDYQFHHIVDESRVLVDGALIVKGLGNHEVEIAVLGVPKDDPIVISVAAKQLIQPLRGRRQMLNGEGYVFDDDRGAALTDRADGGKHSGANLPERGLRRRRVSKLRRLKQLERRGGIGGQRFQFAPPGLQGRLELDQQSGRSLRPAS